MHRFSRILRAESGGEIQLAPEFESRFAKRSDVARVDPENRFLKNERSEEPRERPVGVAVGIKHAALPADFSLRGRRELSSSFQFRWCWVTMLFSSDGPNARTLLYGPRSQSLRLVVALNQPTGVVNAALSAAL